MHLGSFQLCRFIHLYKQPPDQRGSDDQEARQLKGGAKIVEGEGRSDSSKLVKGKEVVMVLNRNSCSEGFQIVTNFHVIIPFSTRW